MSDHILRLCAAVLARLSEEVGFSRCGATWSGMALICALLAGCAGGRPPSTADQAAPSRAEPAAAQAATARPGTWSSAPVAAAPALLQRRRQAIAEMLEALPGYRTISWVKLTDAKLAGPFEYKEKAIFTSATWTSTLYCASAKLDLPILPIVRTAVIRVARSSEGQERLSSRAPSPFECGDANYGPFPELEEARAIRRKGHGLD